MGVVLSEFLSWTSPLLTLGKLRRRTSRFVGEVGLSIMKSGEVD